MPTTVVHLGGRPVSLSYRDFEDDVDVDRLTSIDYSNLYGEAVTCPALLNQVGILKAEAEAELSLKKLDMESKEAALRQKLRNEAAETAQKMTESSLDEKIATDAGMKILKKNYIVAKKDIEIVDSLYWAIKSKDTKLNNLISAVTPSELFDELQEGVINNILLKKHKSIVSR